MKNFHALQFYCLSNKYKKLSRSVPKRENKRESKIDGKLLLPPRVKFFIQTPQKWRKRLEVLSGEKIMT